MSLHTWMTEHPDAVDDLITGQRWFGDKSRTPIRFTPTLVHEFAHDGHQFGLFEVLVEFSEGAPSTYFMPLWHRTDDHVIDALLEPSFLSWLAEGFAHRRTIETAKQDRIVWTPAGDVDALSWTSRAPRVLTGEQSNTSVIFGERAILKVFRKLQPGVNPDSEIVAFLSEHHDFAHVPSYLGSIVLESDGDREPVELAAVQGFVLNGGDCWRWLPGALGSAANEELGNLLDSVSWLGVRTGELHVALGDAAGVTDFEPMPFTSGDIAALEDRLGREVRLTASMLHRDGALSHAGSESLASSLLASISHVDVLLGSLKIRVHGDYHLGQVLRAVDDFVIIDFEGEPSRTMAERRQKSSPLKDVAGMLRSIDYAVATVLADPAVSQAHRDTLEWWRETAETAFVSGYLSIVNNPSRGLVPDDDEHAFERALDLFMIEKALYEVRYELDNRPEWLDIPLGALRRIGAGD